MPTVRFEGRVLPIAFGLTIHNNTSLTWEEEQIDLSSQIHVAIKDGFVTIDCELQKFDQQQHLQWLLMRALDVGRVVVNLAAFSVGAGLELQLENYVGPDGSRAPLILRDRPLAAICTAFDSGTASFDEVLQIVITDTRLYHALRDLIEAISAPHLMAPRCASAIETLRVCMTPAGADRKNGWKALRDKLRISESYLKTITDHSKGPRHGDHQYVPAEMTREIAHKSWTVMNRYLECRKRGDVALPLSDFPILT